MSICSEDMKNALWRLDAVIDVTAIGVPDDKLSEQTGLSSSEVL